MKAWLAVAQAGAIAWGVLRERKRIPLKTRALDPSDARALNNNMVRIETAVHPGLDMADLRARHQIEAVESPSKLRQIGKVALEAGKQWVDRRAASKGAALSLYTLFSMAPMLVLVVAVAGLVFGADTVRTVLVEQMQNLMGAKGGDAIKTILSGTQQEDSTFWASLVSGVLVLISATSAFAELKSSLNELWDVSAETASGIWGFLRDRVLSFGLVMVLALMLMISLVVSTGLDALQNLWAGGDAVSIWHTLLKLLSNVVSFGIVTILFAAIFKYLPNVPIGWKDVLIGALITAALFIIGKTGISLYVSHAEIDSSYGAAGSIVILITWIYYSAQIFFYGALFTHEYAVQIGSHSGAAPRPGQQLPRSNKKG